MKSMIRGKKETMRRNQVTEVLEKASEERETGGCVTRPKDKLKNGDCLHSWRCKGGQEGQSEEWKSQSEEKGTKKGQCDGGELECPKLLRL